MVGHRLGLIFGWCVLAVGCAGKALNDQSSGASGAPSAAGSANGGASNGALTPEIRDTGIRLDSVLGQLDAAEQSALCKAYGAWRFRLREQFCWAFVESAVVLMPRTTEEARQLCVDAQDICHTPTEPMPACTGFAPGCSVTAAELDRCIADQEQWLDAVPTCQSFTYENAQLGVAPTPDSCARFNFDAGCQLVP